MERVVSIEDALRGAVHTAEEQPRELPAVPHGWLLQAKAALAAEDQAGIRIAADTILMAHSQYRAESDIKGWLYELRNAVRAAR
ncbi:hypothetical protein WS63_07820 [Burkholderia stagnalis]|uniref:hypothetical protein n=1 Tax=Burkholderia stagnalis TaxID=1503054 RepID=UPI000752EFC2|nr:hypothetical protein [Burkholderia stagnalis]KVD92933.1 hypothetical protein WS63_07820 [Burkholderia stagnalis]